MKMKARKLLSVLLAICMLAAILAGCSGSNSSDGSTSDSTTAANGDSSSESTESGSTDAERIASNPNNITDYYTYQTAAGEVDTWNVLYTQTATTGAVLGNLVDPLLMTDPHGNIVPCLAESYEVSEDGLTWTFNLRDNATWVDYNGNYMADVKSSDWVYSLEWIFNFWKNDGNNTSMLSELLEGVEDYYEYTKEMEEEEAYALDISVFTDMVSGIETPDDYTVIYHLTKVCPYFASIAVYNAMSPAPTDLISTTDAADYKALDNTGIWYCGPYTITTFVSGNEKVYTKNESYWDDTVYRFNTVTVKMLESSSVAYELWKNGEIDYVSLNSSTIATIPEGDELYDKIISTTNNCVYQFNWNYAKNLEDGTPDTNWNTAISNMNFRKSLYYGVNLYNYMAYANPFEPLTAEAYTLSAKTLATMSDGRDYTDLVYDLIDTQPNGEEWVRFDADKAEEYKQAAIEELTALGVTFPIEVDYYIPSGNQTSLDSATIMKQCFEDSLGTDYINFQIKTYISSATKEVYTPSLQSFNVSGWMADYGDPFSYLQQWILGDANAYYTTYYTHADQTTGETAELFQQYTDLVNEANAIVDDMDARYEKFAEAEAFCINNALIFSVYRNTTLQFTCVNNYSKITSVFGGNSGRYVNWETNYEGYTTADDEAFREAFNAE
jgi:oligopeptide transport system substrate-binding protein